MKTDNDLVVRPAHLMLALNLSDRALHRHIAIGGIPGPDGRGHGAGKLWRLSTIQAWNPRIGALVAELINHPDFGPRPQRYANTPLLEAA